MAVSTSLPAEPAGAQSTGLSRVSQVFGRVGAATTATDADSIDAFASEAPSAATKPAAPKKTVAALTPRAKAQIVAALVGVAVLATTGVVLWLRLHRAAPTVTASGTISVDTRPAGAEILIDGQRRGSAPLSVALAPGKHWLTVRSGGEERMVPITVAAGSQLAQYFELAPAAAPAPVFGRISVVTDPPGARVTVDGRTHGVSPLTIADLSVAQHKIAVSSETGSAERTVAVEAGTTTSVVFALPKVSAPFGGWVTIKAPFDVQITEAGEVVGVSGSTKIMLAAGRHDLTFVNRALGFQQPRSVDVAAGKTAVIQVTPPTAAMSANARPWAEVLIDGTSVGQTPISNVQIAIGTHQVTFRHPQYGERTQSITITAAGPNRVAVDLTK